MVTSTTQPNTAVAPSTPVSPLPSVAESAALARLANGGTPQAPATPPAAPRNARQGNAAARVRRQAPQPASGPMFPNIKVSKSGATEKPAMVLWRVYTALHANGVPLDTITKEFYNYALDGAQIIRAMERVVTIKD